LKRKYASENKIVEIEEIEDVIAVKQESRGGLSSKQIDTFGKRVAPSSVSDVDKDDWQAFENAGWVLIQPSSQLKESFKSEIPSAERSLIQRVFLESSGRILLGTDRLSVMLKPDLTDEEVYSVFDATGLEIVSKLKFAPNLYEVRVRAEVDFLQASLDLSENSDFVFAEPEFIEHIPQRYTPSDPNYPQQWHLNNTGQSGGTPGADISAEEAWNMTRGSAMRIAIVDNGFDVNHPDLSASVDPVSGFFQTDTMGNTTFRQGTAGYPDDDHGTFCAGMALARADNGQGGSGVSNLANFIAIACLADQVGSQVTLARAIAYAADPTQEVPGANPNDGADVISCSLGPNGANWTMTTTLRLAIDFAVTNGRGGLGTPIFWAVTNGNFQIQFDQVCSYANTIHVGRSTHNDLEDNCGFGPELDFLAPGVVVYSTTSGGGYATSTGTSFAAPTAAGLGSLVLAVNPNLPWQQVRQIIRDTCDKIGGVMYDPNGHNDDYGFGRINAARACCNAGRLVTLETPSVNFNDVPEGETTARAIVFSVISCQAATFQIVSGPTVISGPGNFGMLSTPNSSLPATTNATTREARLWLSFTGTNDGDITTGEIRVRLVETGEEWLIPISANTIARPTVAAVMVLDQSGSMQGPSGLPGFTTRNDVLKFAAPVFVNLIQEHNGIGMVDFDHDAYNRMNIQTVGAPSAFDPTRNTALGVIAAHAPNLNGFTAIGDGVETAHNMIGSTTSFDYGAIIVFTDGHETASKRIAEVAPFINERVFAIGLGTADQIQPTSLVSLTNGTGGYLLLTGVVGPDDLFRLSKYYLQILAGVTNMDIVLDPEGAIKPGQKHRIPFQLNEADIGVDVILLSETNLPLFQFMIETPSGDLIDPAASGTIPGVSYVNAQGVSFYRMTMPVPVGVTGSRSGLWHVILTVNQDYYKRYLSKLENLPELYKKVLAHGVRYNLSVHSYSGIRLQAQLTQNSLEPGAILTIRAVLTEYGLPISANRAQVKSIYEYPDGTTGSLILNETEVGSGIYTANFVTSLSGVYPCRILAQGTTLRGRKFTREHILTGSVWKGGDNPSTQPKNPDKDSNNLCEVLKCLLSEKVITPKLEKQLQDLGLDLSSLRACVKT
jgi:subtilisin family serine protease